jgi:hypothetical protein
VWIQKDFNRVKEAAQTVFEWNYFRAGRNARVRFDLLEFPTGSLPVIRAFQPDKPQMRKLKKKRSSWSITSDLPVRT